MKWLSMWNKNHGIDQKYNQHFEFNIYNLFYLGIKKNEQTHVPNIIVKYIFLYQLKM